jgi:uncharacterized repeat protein (TIGR01451 family)
MKQLLILSLFTLCTLGKLAAQSSTLPITIQAQLICHDWCGGNTGQADAYAFGGTPPYSYLWSMGAITSQVSGLSAGIYDVTVTDATATTATATIQVSSVSQSPFYAISVMQSQQGLNDGKVYTGIYPDPSGGSSQSASSMPAGTFSFILMDSAGVVESITETYCIGCFNNQYHDFDSLKQGHYTLECSMSPGGCSTFIDFDIKDLPVLNPTFSSLPACNGSPTGNLNINTHPSPSIDGNTFIANINSTLSFGTQPFSNTAYKVLIYDSLNFAVGHAVTRDSLVTFTGIAPGNYQLHIYTGEIDLFNSQYIDSTLIYSGIVTVQNDTTCSLVKGKVFADYNNNCIFNFNDIALSGVLIELSPGGFNAITNAAGDYFIPVPVGIYTVKQYAPFGYRQLCPDTATFTINNSAAGLIFNVNIADSVSATPDVQIGLTASAARPGFNTHYKIKYKNLTPSIIPAGIISLSYDTNLTFFSTSLTPTTTSAGLLTWNMASMAPFETRNITVEVNVPVATVIGTPLTATASVTPASGEINTGNNSDNVQQIVTGSFDPNDITVSPVGYTSAGYITNSEILKYTVRFQNTGNDTAFNVVVIDPLPSSLDKYSLQVLNASHNYWYEFRNPNVVAFHFDNLLLPDSTTNEEASHGTIKYSIAQVPGNVSGTVINNKADIYFDFNAPVITNEVKNTIYDCAQIATMNLVPATICEGIDVVGNADLLFAMNTQWFLDSVFYASDSSVIFTGLSPGTHTVSCVASTNNCTSTLTQTLTVNPLPSQPAISQASNTLSSTSSAGYQWMLIM